jgi:hypothetical protein
MIIAGSLAWWIENKIARFLWEKESNLCPLLLLSRKMKNLSLSWHHDIARGGQWRNTPREIVPTVGWKRAPLSTVSNYFQILDKCDSEFYIVLIVLLQYVFS